MCEQCCAEIESYLEVLPGWTLVRATVNGMEMLKGQWGLVRTEKFDDPEFIWTNTPRPIGDLDKQCDQFDDNERGTPEYDETFDAWFAWQDEATSFGKFFQISPDLGWALVEESHKLGYDPGTEPFHQWLFNHLGEWVRDHKPFPFKVNKRDKFFFDHHEEYGYGKPDLVFTYSYEVGGEGVKLMHTSMWNMTIGQWEDTSVNIYQEFDNATNEWVDCPERPYKGKQTGRGKECTQH